MSKIETQTRYNNMSFTLERETKALNMYFNDDNSYCLITDKAGNVIFEIRADSSQNFGYLEDALNN